MTATGTRALELVRGAGIAHRVHAYESPERRGRERDARPSYGLDVAAALHVAPGRVFKTLAAVADDRLVLAFVPVDRELDLKRLADACGARRAVLAEPAAAERATGYVIGGISPLGTRRPLPVFIDTSGLAFDTIFISAGRRGLQLELAGADLVRLAGATVAVIVRARPTSCRRPATLSTKRPAILSAAADPPRTRSVADGRSGGEYCWQQQIQEKSRHKSRSCPPIPRGHRPIERGPGTQTGHFGLGPPAMASSAPELLLWAARPLGSGRHNRAGVLKPPDNRSSSGPM